MGKLQGLTFKFILQPIDHTTNKTRDMVIFINLNLIYMDLWNTLYNIYIRCDIICLGGSAEDESKSDRAALLTVNRTYAVTRDNTSGHIKRETVCQNCCTCAPANLQRRILRSVIPLEILSEQKR